MDNILKKVRTDFGYTQEKMAEKLGIHKQTYIRYENGKRNIPSKILKRISEISGETLDYLFGYQNITGNNNTQISGNNISVRDNNGYDKDFLEIVELLKEYANPKMLSDLKEKLLKIKELS
ncbi:putative transcriptional regulator, XRE family [Campylobacter pinnipediorum subsp. caledonicus]|uniref:Putative transcriptional regulator, XRE family n=1 Tax=Campylobacter pinnipediorum subsp. caledonicus TaxID=1874362 RepID=A0A1S6U853_9BACT|nr:helix-turn-helix transcriptional regulator [Campylobacter pinnipediorum]AQW85454.1 putative transcriptional regulator, XRE family [Campylobacter pinnipediorum subsp. caledonicus]AQW87869.1 putative transcriptional regulator, XRE family [Campylobacter pinnipediorum subsp. caledonicus]